MLAVSAFAVAVPKQARADSETGLISADGVDIRVDPKDKAKSQLKAYHGQMCAVLDHSQDGQWVKVSYDFEHAGESGKVVGWIPKKFIRSRSRYGFSWEKGTNAGGGGAATGGDTAVAASKGGGDEWGGGDAGGGGATTAKGGDAAATKGGDDWGGGAATDGGSSSGSGDAKPAATPTPAAAGGDDWGSSGSGDAKPAETPAPAGDDWGSSGSGDTGAKDGGGEKTGTDDGSGW